MFDVIQSPNPIDHLLYLPKTPVAAFHGVRRRRKLFVIEKNQTPIHCRRFRFFQQLRQMFEPLHPQSRFFQRRLRSTPTIVQAIHLIHDLTQLAQLRQGRRLRWCIASAGINEPRYGGCRLRRNVKSSANLDILLISTRSVIHRVRIFLFPVQ